MTNCLQRVRPIDERLDATELAIVRVDEAGEEAKHDGASIGEGFRASAATV